MKFPAIALKNYQFILILIAIGTFLGISAIRNMPRNEDPNPQFPFYMVVAVYPGTSPEDMEELIVEPLEDVIDQLDDIDKISTTIEEGLAVIQVEAAFQVDVDDKYDEVLREVKAVEPTLPADLFSLEVDQFEPTKTTKIQQVALLSPKRSFRELEEIGDEMETALEQLPGVDDVELEAFPAEIVEIQLDYQRMAAFRISYGQIAAILRAENLNIPAGDFEAGSRSFSIQSSGSFASLEEIRNVVIQAADDQLVHLRDVATIQLGYDEDTWIGRYNGKRALFLSITQKNGQNLVETGEEINQILAGFRQELPTDYEIHTVFEQAPAVQARINGFFMNLLQGVMLVGIIIFLFLGFRSSILIMLVIPLSIIMGIALLQAADYALQQISIAALVIALGLLVDNGIVVVENIQRFLKAGLSPVDAAIKGTSEVGFAIISSTVTTLLAFLPLVMLQSGPGEFLRSLPLTVIFVLVISLILALTFTPMVAGRILNKTPKQGAGPIGKYMDQLSERVYRPALHVGLRRGWLFLTSGVVLLFGSLMLFPSIGVTFFPTADKPILLIEVDAPRGSSMDRTARAVQFVEAVLDTAEYVKDFASNVGHGNPTIYYNRMGENYKKYHGQLLVNFQEWNAGLFYKTLQDFRKVFNQYPDARITFSELKNGPPVEAPIEIKIIGDDLSVLKSLAYQVESLVADQPGIINLTNPMALDKTDVEVVINRDKASMSGVQLVDIDQAVRSGVDGLTVDEVSFGQDEYDLILQADFRAESLPELGKLYVANNQGDQVPLPQVADLSFKTAVAEILHYNTERSTAITAGLTHPDDAIAITERIISKLEEMEFPDGYRYYIAGEYESQQESFGDLGLLLMFAMLGIFAVLVLQFRSLIQPLIVFAAIPLAISGSFLALYLTGWSFSFFAFVGFISLVGIVVNNSIILVDYANQLMRTGVPKREAIEQAGMTRFKPIVLTTSTTILGLAPLTFSASNLWSPLGWTIIGGMISSTLLTLLIIPVLYNWFTRDQDDGATQPV